MENSTKTDLITNANKTKLTLTLDDASFDIMMGDEYMGYLEIDEEEGEPRIIQFTTSRGIEVDGPRNISDLIKDLENSLIYEKALLETTTLLSSIDPEIDMIVGYYPFEGDFNLTFRLKEENLKTTFENNEALTAFLELLKS